MKAPFPTMHSTVNSMPIYDTFLHCTRVQTITLCDVPANHMTQGTISLSSSQTQLIAGTNLKANICYVPYTFFFPVEENNIFGWLEKDKEFNVSIFTLRKVCKIDFFFKCLN